MLGHRSRVATVQEFAERVLMGTSLEDKLGPPPQGVMDEGRSRVAIPGLPGRPEGLELRQDGVRAAFPGTGGIEDDAQRGRLLHFFANHELLAVELMALVLLKFPDAPVAFRRGILQTLREEQMHTKLYLRRMEECGVCFGELPLNGFFWNAVSPMPSPVDYVTRLSLTFEQANLDYAKGYARVFAEAGDAGTAAILERIYRDEIGHVHYGLQWFREWKDGGQSDWEAYRSRLVLPLSAARAKGGFEFNEEGRRAAGLDEEFIAELRVYSQSKGRTPEVFWFNPGAEESLVANWEESPAAAQVRRDLAFLPAFLARREDVVVVPEVVPREHLEALLAAGIEVPEIVVRDEVDTLGERKLGQARPWARTPDAEGVAEAAGLALERCEPRLFAKSEAVRLLRGMVEDSERPLLCRMEDLGRVVCSAGEVEAAWPERRVVVKAPFSTAGRDRIWREAGATLTRVEQAWLEQTLSVQGEVVVEPWLDRVLDFSIQYERKDDGRLRRLGQVRLENTAKGQFRSATAPGRLAEELEEETRRRLFDGATRAGHLAEFIEEELEPAMGDWLADNGHVGPVGIDGMFYRDEDGVVRFKPMIEINPRFTMGRVALELARWNVCGGATRLRIGKSAEGAEKGEIRLTPEREGAVFAAFARFGVGGRSERASGDAGPD